MEKRIKFKTIFSVFILSSLMLAIFRGIVLFRLIDPVSGLYNNAIVGTLFSVLTVIFAVGVIGVYLYAKQSKTSEMSAGKTVVTRISSALCAVAFAIILVCGIINLVTLKNAYGTALAELRGNLFSSPTEIAAVKSLYTAKIVMLLLELLFGVPSFIYFVVRSFGTARLGGLRLLLPVERYKFIPH